MVPPPFRLEPGLNGSFRNRLLAVSILAALAVVVFGQVASHRFVSYDDNKYITDNEIVKKGLTGAGVRWALTATRASNWHPLTWISHMTDVALFGLDPRGHHLASLFFHVLNAALLLLVLDKMTGAFWRSAVVAALFLVHPLHVESVAWAAERKDLLSTLFGLLAILAYAGYARRPRLAAYLPVPLMFALSLAAKPMLVTLPFLLLLLDRWPLRRSGPLAQPGDGGSGHLAPRLRLLAYWDKVPLLILSAGSCAITLVAQSRGDSLLQLERFPLWQRLANAGVSYATYIVKTVWPASLAVFYPLAPGPVAAWKAAAAIVLLLVVTVAVVRGARRFPFLPVGWLWYLGTLVPVIGLVQVGMQSMADRYTYFPLVGLFVMAAWGVSESVPRTAWGRRLPGAVAGIVVVSLSAAAWLQVRHWATSETLFSHALRVTEGNWIAHHNLAVGSYGQGRTSEAVFHFRETLRIRPYYGEAHKGLAAALDRLGRYEEAASHYRLALVVQPGDAHAHNGIGMALGRLGRLEEALGHFGEALRLAPQFPDAINNMGVVLEMQGKDAEALTCFRRALALRPDDAPTRRNLAIVLEKTGRREEAAFLRREAFRSSPAGPRPKLPLEAPGPE